MQVVLVAWKPFPPPAGLAPDAHERLPPNVRGAGGCQGAGLLVCGGLGGVMEAACRGAKAEGGTTVGILPGSNKEHANSYIVIPIATGFGEGRNVFLVRTADVVIELGGNTGRCPKSPLALKTGKSVVGIRTWEVSGVIAVTNEQDAVETAFSLVGK